MIPAINLSKLTDEELLTVKGMIATEDERRDSESKTNKMKQLKETGEFKTLQTDFKELKKGIAALAKNRTVKVMIPVEFTLDNISLVGFRYTEEIDELVEDANVTGRILKTKDLTKEQTETLQQGIERVLEGACEKTLGIFPNMMSAVEELTEDYNSLVRRLEANALEWEDIS